MNKSQKITAIFIGIITLVVIIFDIIVLCNPGENDTVSYVVQMLAHKYPIIPLAAGILCGHFFWPIKGDK